MVLSWQTHTTNVRAVTEEDAGKGIWRERDYQDVDGLVTNVPGITLVTFFADCVPLYVIDPVHRAIGLSHSGWRGTVERMGEKTLKVMEKEYGTRAEDVVVGIGPSICQDCFEVGPEVADAFAGAFQKEKLPCLYYKKENGKYKKIILRKLEYVYLHAFKNKNIENFSNTFTRFLLRNISLLYSLNRLDEISYL